MRVTKAQDTAPVVIVLVDINAKILISKWRTDINYPSAHPPSTQQSCAADGTNGLAYAKSSIWLWKTAKAEDSSYIRYSGRALWRSLPIYCVFDLRAISSPLLQELCMQVFVLHCLNNLESPDRLPENKIPDGESGTWPETSVNLM